MPFIGEYGVVKSINILLWERFGYGPAAIEMIKEHPIDGIGVGTFHALVIDYGRLVGYPSEEHLNILATDNAQSWFRHIIAEFGLIGSIPMLWWCVVFAMTLFSRPARRRSLLGRDVARCIDRVCDRGHLRNGGAVDRDRDHVLGVCLLVPDRANTFKERRGSTAIGYVASKPR